VTTPALSYEERFPEVFRQPFWRRFGPLLMFIGTVLYLLYAVWFFDLPNVVRTAHWDRLGIYLTQWISYDVQPEFRLGGAGIVTKYSRYSVLGADPHPDWVQQQGDGSYVVLIEGQGKSIAFDKAGATLRNEGDTVHLTIGSDKVAIDGPAPAWIVDKGDEVDADFGFFGDVRVATDRIKVSRRFLGWPNFIFDTDSPFFGRSPGEVMSLVLAGPDLKAGVPNYRLAADNFWNNAEWQHGDVWTKLLQTIVMAFLGTLLGAIVALPLAFLAARNITPSTVLNQVLKRGFDFLRSVDMLIWALFFTRAFGPGPLSGSAAIFFTETGTLGKIYSEGLENIDDKEREGVTSTGAHPIQVQRFGVMPQIVPVLVSQTIYQWESNTRGATIIGAVGAGGIGLKLWEAMATNANWQNVAYMVLLILVVIFCFDATSNAIRRRLIGHPG
jgi:phosphonate transport system permease protein